MSNYNIKTDKFGNKFHYLNNNLHRENGPAIEYANGTKECYKNGFLHRKDGPAVEFADGRKWWYKNGNYHREDGPAIECIYGYKQWWLNNKCYGKYNEFTNESWIKFVKTLIFS